MFKLVVLFCGVASMAAPGVMAYGAGGVLPLSAVSPYGSVYGSSVYGPSVYSAGVVPSLYPGLALSQAPHSPALVLDPVHGVPLDTPEVVAARAAHYQAKALSLHHLKKRSAGVVAPLAYSSPLLSSYSSPVLSPYSASVVSPYSASVVSPYSAPAVSAYSSPLLSAYSSPLVSAYSAPVVGSPLAYHGVAPKALSVHPW